VNRRSLVPPPADDENLEVGILVHEVPSVALITEGEVGVERSGLHESPGEVLAYLGRGKSRGGEAFQILDEGLESYLPRHRLLIPDLPGMVV
jgi:hypothetical protein